MKSVGSAAGVVCASACTIRQLGLWKNGKKIGKGKKNADSQDWPTKSCLSDGTRMDAGISMITVDERGWII